MRSGVLLIRAAYDPGWRATVDDEPAPVLIADGFLQAIEVPTGPHEVVLRYEDPWILRGLLLSAIAWALLILAWLGSLFGATTRRPVAAAPPR